jgi:hypothetical protein
VIPSLSLVIAATSVALAVVTVVHVVRGRPLARGATVALAILELALIVQAARDAIGLATGHQPTEPGTHWGYLVSSIVILPLTLAVGQGDRGRWASAALTVGLVATAVVVFRMQQTWYAHGAAA